MVVVLHNKSHLGVDDRRCHVEDRANHLGASAGGCEMQRGSSVTVANTVISTSGTHAAATHTVNSGLPNAHAGGQSSKVLV